MDWSAFNIGPLPDGTKIGRGESIEAQAVEHFFRGKSLADVSLESLRQSYPHDMSACLAFMSDEAFAFFLPAFMRIALEDYVEADSVPDAVIHRLREMALGRDDARRNAIIQRYSAAQLRAIAGFLREMSEGYWHKYPEDAADQAFAYWSKVGGS